MRALIIIVLTFALILIVTHVIVTLISKSTSDLKLRLGNIQTTYVYEDIAQDIDNFTERAIKPFYDSIYNLLKRLTPSNIEKEYTLLLQQAGLPSTYTPIKLITKQVLLASMSGIGSPILTLSLGYKVNVVYVLTSVILAIYMPIKNIRNKIKKRKALIQKELPSLIDMIYVSVEAGLSFDMALRTTAQKMPNALGYEIMRAMSDISKGRNREEALRSIGIRTQVEDVRIFIATVIQSEKLGSNISNILRIQSEVIRDKRRQYAEAEANKMPIKMLFPLIFFMFPALFIVIIGPAAITALDALMKSGL